MKYSYLQSGSHCGVRKFTLEYSFPMPRSKCPRFRCRALELFLRCLNMKYARRLQNFTSASRQQGLIVRSADVAFLNFKNVMTSRENALYNYKNISSSWREPDDAQLFQVMEISKDWWTFLHFKHRIQRGKNQKRVKEPVWATAFTTSTLRRRQWND